MSDDNQSKINQNRQNYQEANRIKTLECKLKKEMGVIRQICYVKAKNREKQVRISNDFKAQETKLMKDRDTILQKLDERYVASGKLKLSKGRGKFLFFLKTIDFLHYINRIKFEQRLHKKEKALQKLG